jgi:threonine/homoserine/homoserine lactone efflux protein
MTLEGWLALCSFAFVMAATPGPNNLMLLSCGLNHGFRCTLPFLAGIAVGFLGLLGGIGVGLGFIFERVPLFQLTLKMGGSAYFVWLAYRLATSSSGGEASTSTIPSLWLGASFQFVNPKAWMMAVTAVSMFLPPTWTPSTLATFIATFLMIGLPCNAFWAGAGALLATMLESPAHLRRFNRVMAALMVVAISTVWLPLRPPSA